MKSASALAGLLIAGVFLGPHAGSFNTASAADSGYSVTVAYGDLDPASPVGARRLYGRIQSAARTACGNFWFKSNADAAACLKSTIAKAVTEVNQPALTAVYNTRYPVEESPRLASQNP